ncbi:MAG: tetratricopeptide repeat protein [Gammaproteobacteria bacterium]|nr:tetratricopeptide repeat protein [Gammaproteobacteria bacterium]
MKADLRVVCLVLSIVPAIAQAQAVKIIGGGAHAKECFNTASLAAMATELGGFSDAACTRAIEDSPLSMHDRVATYINRGIVRVGNRDFAEGFADYEAAMKLSPDTPETYVNVANVYYLGEKYDRAIELYTQSLELGLRRSHVAYFNRGMANEHLGRYTAAEADYRQALEYSPDWESPRDKLDGLMRKQQAAGAEG